MSESAGNLTDTVLAFVETLDSARLPQAVRHECVRSFVDSMGCVLGGARHPLVEIAFAGVEEVFGPPQATILGRGRKADLLNAVLINGTAGAAYSYFDTYSDALLHPGVPVAVTLLALAERNPVSGAAFLSAYAAGVEVACRLTKATALPPAAANVGWSQTGIAGGAAAAVAAAKLLGLDRRQLGWALGIAASEAAGTRAEHGSMAASLIFGHTAQTGLRAALLAARGLTASPGALDSRYGFANIFAEKPNLPALTDGLGTRFEISDNTYKPYPSGIVTHAATDAMLRLKAEAGLDSRAIVRIEMKVGKGAATFGMRPDPVDEIEAKLSLHHWVAVAAMHGRAGIAEGRLEVVKHPEIMRLRAAMQVEADPAMAGDAAEVAVVLADGRRIESRVAHCVGSIRTPMTDAQLSAKFVDQAGMVVGPDRAAALVADCWNIARLDDVGALARAAA